MKVSRPAKMLSVLVAIFALLAVSAMPASAGTGYWWVANSAGGCLDYSDQFEFRVFSCNGDARYQRMYIQNINSYGPDAYSVKGKSNDGRYRNCLSAYDYGQTVSTLECGRTRQQVWIIRYSATGRPYFDSLSFPGQCLTRSGDDGKGGFLLTTEGCSGRESQYWRLSQ